MKYKLSLFILTLLSTVIVNAQVTVSHFAGQVGNQGYNDGHISTATFGGPADVAMDSLGNIYVSDVFNHAIRKITPDDSVSTFVGNGIAGYVDSNGTNAQINNPQGILYGHDGYLYITDAGNHCIRKVDLNGNVTTFAGHDTTFGYINGPATSARFRGVMGLAQCPHTYNIYAADPFNHSIRVITQAGMVSTYAGDTISGYLDDTASNARFLVPTSVVLDSEGNLYVSEPQNHTVRKISTDTVVTTYAGDNIGGYVNGYRTNGLFEQPFFLSIGSEDDIYVADQGNWVLRHISTDDTLSLVAGVPGTSGHQNGSGDLARFFNLSGSFVDGKRALYITDFNNRVIRKVTADEPTSVSVASSFCKGTSATLIADGGTTYRWYESAESDSILYEGNDFQTPLLYESTTFYVSNVYKGLESERVAFTANPVELPLQFSYDACYAFEPNYTARFYNLTQNRFNYDFVWHFGDGDTSSVVSPQHTFLTDDVFEISMTAQHHTTGCRDTLVQEVQILESPEAAFTVNEACEGSLVNFQNISSISYNTTLTYEWDFGDGTQSGDENPVYTFDSSSIYQVELVVTSDSTSCKGRYSLPFEVYALPLADFSISGECAFDTVHFSNQSVSADVISTSLWSFHDGDEDTNWNTHRIFNQADTIYASLILETVNACTDTFTMMHEILEAPTASFDLPFSICQDQEVMLLDASIGGVVSYLWHLGDGNTATGQNAVHSWTDSGYHHVTLTVTNEKSCSNTFSEDIYVNPSPLAAFTLEDHCEGEMMPLNNATDTRGAGNVNYLWGFGDQATSTDIAPGHTYSNYGVYQILLEVSSDECIDTATQLVEVIELPNSEFSFEFISDLVVQFNPLDDNQAEYFWDFGDGQTSSDVTPLHTYEEYDNYEVSLTVTGERLCQSEYSDNLQLTSLSENEKLSFGLNIFPNPVKDELSLSIELYHQTELKVLIYDIQGRKLAELMPASLLPEGMHEFNMVWPDTVQNPGIYILSVQTENAVVDYKLIKQ